MEQELISAPIFSGVRVTRSLVLCVCLVDRFFILFSFGHCVVCSTSIYGLWLHLWYLRSLLSKTICVILSSVCRAMFFRSLFVLLSFFFWPLCSMFFDLRLWLPLHCGLHFIITSIGVTHRGNKMCQSNMFTSI